MGWRGQPAGHPEVQGRGCLYSPWLASWQRVQHSRPLLCHRCQPLPAVSAPVHDLTAAAASRQALGHRPAQHLGAEHPPGLPLSCLATTTAVCGAARLPARWGPRGQPQPCAGCRGHTSCPPVLGVDSLREPGLMLAFLLLSSALGTCRSPILVQD